MSPLTPDKGAPLGQGPASTYVLWPNSESGPWHLKLHWGRVAGRIECTSLEIKSDWTPSDTRDVKPPGWHPEPQAVTASLLRKLTGGQKSDGPPIGQIIREDKESLAQFHVWWAHIDEERREQLQQRVKKLIDAQPKSSKGGRPPKYGPGHFAEVAEVYANAYQQGLDPTRIVAQHWNRSTSTAAKWVARARKLGFLGPTTRGKPGGVITQRDEEEQS